MGSKGSTSKLNILQEQVMEVGSSSAIASCHNRSQESQTKRATKLLDESEKEIETWSQEDKSVWGHLYSIGGTSPRINLTSESFTLGRASSCHYVIKETDMGGIKWLEAVSLIQCEIFKNNEGIFIRDCSSNGTWVNGHKIGKGRMWPLEHNSEICFATTQKKLFVFIAREVTDTFPPELTAKYTVSKELGKGAGGIVRLGFRIQDLHRVAIKIIEKKTSTEK